MSINFFQFNPIPIVSTEITVKQEWLDVANNFNYVRMPADNGHYTSYKYVLNKLPGLQLEIAKVIEYLTRDILRINKKIGFKFLNSWINIHNKNDYSHHHYHSNSVFSGVYYLKAEEGQGDLEFNNNTYSNNIGSLFKYEYDELNLINSSQHVFRSRTGSLIIFPSHLPHRVMPNTSNNKRISLAFNVFPYGEWGDSEGRMSI